MHSRDTQDKRGELSTSSSPPYLANTAPGTDERQFDNGSRSTTATAARNHPRTHSDLENVSTEKQRPSTTSRGGSKAVKCGRLACDTCRERKVRCDRAWPKCGRCARLGDNCTYVGRTRHRQTQGDIPRQLKQLQDRLSQAEARLSARPPDSRLYPDLVPDLEFFAENQHDVLPPTTGRSASGSESEASVAFSRFDHGIDVLNSIPDDVFDLPHSELNWLHSPSALNFATDDGASALTKNMRSKPAVHYHNAPTGPPSVGTPPGQASGQTPAATTATHTSTSGLSHLGVPDKQISPSDLRNLHDNYFEIFYPIMPILARDRFFSHIQINHDTPQVQALSYAVALVGAMVSPEHRHLEDTCVSMARNCIEMCERDDGLPMMLSLDLFQALLFLVRFELTHRKILRAWITIGRAVRLANLLGLHLNNPELEASGEHEGLPPTTEPVCQEERRRAFWTLFICETYASSRARLPPLLQEHHITIPLPSPGILSTDFELLSMPTLAESDAAGDLKKASISPFAGIVLACAIARRCQPHAGAVLVASSSPDAWPSTASVPCPSANGTGKGFWDRHFALITLLKHRVELLAPHMTVRAVQTDPVSFALYVYLCGIDIALQEAAVAQVEKQGLSPTVAADSAKRSRTAAYRLVGAARGTLPRHKSAPDYFALHGAFMARPLATAVQVLGRDLHREPESPASATISDSLQLLLEALDRVEEEGGFWHETVEPIAQAVQEWEERHGNRSADTWAASLVPGT